MSKPEEPSYFEVGKKMAIEAENALLDVFGIEHEDHANSTTHEEPKEKAPPKPVVVSILEAATIISDVATDAATDAAEAIDEVKKMVVEAEDSVFDVFGIEHDDHGNSTTKKEPKEKEPSKPVVVSILETATIISDAANDAVESIVEAFSPHEKTTTEKVVEKAHEVAETIKSAVVPPEKTTAEVVKESVSTAANKVSDTASAAVTSISSTISPKEPTTMEVVGASVEKAVTAAAAVVDKAGNDLVQAVKETIADIDKPREYPPHHKSDFEVCAEEFNAGTADLPAKEESAKESTLPVPPHTKSAFEVCAEPLHIPGK